MPYLISVDQQLKDAAKIITNPPLIIPAEYQDSSLFFHLAYLNAVELQKKLPLFITKAFNYAQSYRLGHYFEHLIKCILAASDYTVLNNHNVLYDGKQTVGELDFLLKKLPNEEVVHLETAYKIYARTDQGWFGPNPTDSLKQKVQHLFQKQITLFQRYEKQWLASGLQRPTSFNALIQGRLFLPTNILDGAAEIPNSDIKVNERDFMVNLEDCYSGKWVLRDQFQSYALSIGQEYWQLLDKTSWISTEKTDAIFHLTEIETLIAPHQSAILKAVIEPSSFSILNVKKRDDLVLFLPTGWPKTR